MKRADCFEVRFRPIVIAYLLSSTRLALGYLSTYVWCVLLGLMSSVFILIVFLQFLLRNLLFWNLSDFTCSATYLY